MAEFVKTASSASLEASNTDKKKNTNTDFPGRKLRKKRSISLKQALPSSSSSAKGKRRLPVSVNKAEEKETESDVYNLSVERDECLWMPCTTLDKTKLENFVELVRSETGLQEDAALNLLYRNKYSIVKATAAAHRCARKPYDNIALRVIFSQIVASKRDIDEIASKLPFLSKKSVVDHYHYLRGQGLRSLSKIFVKESICSSYSSFYGYLSIINRENNGRAAAAINGVHRNPSTRKGPKSEANTNGNVVKTENGGMKLVHKSSMLLNDDEFFALSK
ncbi:hypothetical protein AB6A40_009018 [Gnathostoma spinigerum]|uniref:Uncharacterized protein n=1 Tax=Gnathostoma spinigerum TaxID=75299 RepID=A0ABD6EYI0_9BILA